MSLTNNRVDRLDPLVAMPALVDVNASFNTNINVTAPPPNYDLSGVTGVPAHRVQAGSYLPPPPRPVSAPVYGGQGSPIYGGGK